MTAETDPGTPLLLVQRRYEGSGRAEAFPALDNTVFDARYFLQVAKSGDKPMWYRLRDAGQPMPTDAYNAATLVGGAHSYYHSSNHPSRHEAWWNRLNSRDQDSFTVWGNPFGKNQYFDHTRPIRSRSGRGVVYTRWPIFGVAGALSHFGWMVVRVEFAIWDRKKGAPDVLKVAVHRHLGTVEVGNAGKHQLPFGDLDNHWQKLMMHAMAGFAAHCQDQPPDDLLGWREWFFDQRVKEEADRLKFGDGYVAASVVGKAWLDALDTAEEPWQLHLALNRFCGRFLEVPSDPGRVPTEGQLLEDYFRLRPERRELLEQWMTDYVYLLGNEHN